MVLYREDGHVQTQRHTGKEFHVIIEVELKRLPSSQGISRIAGNPPRSGRGEVGLSPPGYREAGPGDNWTSDFHLSKLSHSLPPVTPLESYSKK